VCISAEKFNLPVVVLREFCRVCLLKTITQYEILNLCTFTVLCVTMLETVRFVRKSV